MEVGPFFHHWLKKGVFGGWVGLVLVLSPLIFSFHDKSQSVKYFSLGRFLRKAKAHVLESRAYESIPKIHKQY